MKETKDSTKSSLWFKFEKGQPQPIVRLNSSEMNSEDWESLIKDRLKHITFPKLWHRMGSSNELHAAAPDDCPYCRKRGIKTSSAETDKSAKSTKKKVAPKKKATSEKKAPSKSKSKGKKKDAKSK